VVVLGAVMVAAKEGMPRIATLADLLEAPWKVALGGSLAHLLEEPQAQKRELWLEVML